MEEARGWADANLGIKACLGFGVREDTTEIEELRAAVGDECRLMVDGVWRYNLGEAVRVGRAFERNGVDFLESPLMPEDVIGHARLCDTLDIAIAIGEPLRTRFQFLPWFTSRALTICQPDVMRNGVSETVKIATLAESFNIPVAPHIGCPTVVGMAATWQTAAALPDLLVREFQPVMLETFNPWLVEHRDRSGPLRPRC
ncbi:MAG: enolase C-terminal domain-like protein [Propionibacteriaceae bacterium]